MPLNLFADMNKIGLSIRPILLVKKDVTPLKYPPYWVDLAPVVQMLDSAIHWINHYPLDNSIGFASVYPLDSDLSGGQRYPSFE